MQEIFNFKRFGLLTMKHLNEHGRSYLMGSLILVGIMVALFILFIVTGRGTLQDQYQFVIYALTLFPSAFILTAGIFKPYHQQRKAIYQQLLPASAMEKFLLTWLITFVGYFICFNLLYHLVRYAVVSYLAYINRPTDIVSIFGVVNSAEDSPSLIYFILIGYLIVHAFAFLGAISFRKHALPLSALVLFSFFGIYIYYNLQVFASIFSIPSQNTNPIPFTPMRVYTQEGNIQLTITNILYWGFAFCVLICSMLYVSAYFKFKEKEI